MSDHDQLQLNVCKRLLWHTSVRDEAKVADHLFRQQEMDSVYALDEPTLFDFFFHYLRDINVFELLENLEPPKQQRENIPFIQFVLIYLMKVVGSIPKMEPIDDLLLTNELLMSLCGFNAHQVINGTCDRGTKLRKSPPPQIRGAICVDTLANQIVKISPRRLENFFNNCIQLLAAARVFPKYIHAACDTTLYETTQQYQGCGKVTRTRKVKARGYRKNGELKEVAITLYGWKIWAIYDPNTGIPLAIKIDTIEKPDNLHALAALAQAQENVRGKSTIRSLVVDRGFIDGKFLYAVDQQDIQFIIPSKSNMEATHDARQLALYGNQADSIEVSRQKTITHGYGKNKTQEQQVTTLIGIPGLLSCNWFNPEGSKANTAKKDYEPIPLNAVVVKTWDNKTLPLDSQVVFITNGDITDPFVIFDRYDDRSLIENNLFRDTKQNWHLEHPPKKSKEGVFVHVYMVMAMKALTTAFLEWQKDQCRLDGRGKTTSWGMYRKEQKTLNQNRLIVFFGIYFGIFLAHEVFMLAGVPVREMIEEFHITTAQIYEKYTGKPPPDSS